MRKWLAWLGGVAGGFCAGLLAYVAVFGLIGMVLAKPYSEMAPCWPHYSVFGVIEAECENITVDAMWWGTVELARVVVVIPAVALGLFVSVVKSGSTSWLIDALVLTLYSVPVGLFIWAGFRQWRSQFPVVAWLLLASFVGQIVASG